MKKLLAVLIVVFGLTLSGCIPIPTDNNDDTNNDTETVNQYTEEELRDLIEEMIPETEVNTTYDLDSFNTAIKDMINVAKDGVIGIINLSSTASSTGSGVIYKQVDNTYYVVTNEHVVVGAEQLSIVYENNGILFEIMDDDITVLGMDATTDLAVITFTSEQDFYSIPIADGYDIQVGEFVFALGNPLGFEYYGTVTLGVVSGLARYVQDGDFNATLLQHDAAISPGNSGGALIDINGELIGINNMKIVESNVSMIGFAIPSNTVLRIIEDIEDDGIVTRPYLGISTYAQVNLCGLNYGVCVEVIPGGAAEAAGLEDGDVIIGYKTSSMDDFADIYNFNDLKEAILNSQVGEEVEIKYIRDGNEIISDPTTLEVHPED